LSKVRFTETLKYGQSRDLEGTNEYFDRVAMCHPRKYGTGGLGDGSPLSGVQGQSPGRGSGDEVPLQKLNDIFAL